MEHELRARDAIVAHCRLMLDSGLVTGTAGNISVRLGEWMLITPSGVPYESLSADEICRVPLAESESFDARASSETPLHRMVYAASPAQAIVHTHGLYSVAVANTLTELPVEHYYSLRLGGSLRVARYARFGSSELAENVRGALDSRRAALMQNHGACAIGDTLEEAYSNAGLVEWLCELATVSRSLGVPRALTAKEQEEVERVYAQRRRR